MLAEVDLPVIDRAVVERVFGLGRRQAIQLMHRFGGHQAGRTFLIDRKRLVDALDQIAATGECGQEQARHEKLTAALAKVQNGRRAQEVRIEAPPNMEPGRLEFSGCEDLPAKLFALAQAAANDYATFQTATDGTAPQQ